MPRDHQCPGGCGKRVSGALLACAGCWLRLPTHLRKAVREAYRRNTDRHRVAVQEAVAWYAENPLPQEVR